jgi:hypothetical protein
MLQVRIAETKDIRALHDHLSRLDNKSPHENEIIFSPTEELWDRPYAEFKNEKTVQWSIPVTETGWSRNWILTDETQLFGELTLTHRPPIKTSLHRAYLMMGIEKPHRTQGHGSRLIDVALT